MDPFFERIYLEETNRQCSYALLAVERVNLCIQNEDSIEMLFYELQTLLSYIAAISRILWPPVSRKRKSINRATKRGIHLRQTLNIPSDHVLQCRDLRNHLEHYDERLDEWVQESSHHNIGVNIVGRVGVLGGPAMSQKDIFRQYDPAEKLYIFRGESFNVQVLVDGIKDIMTRIEKRLPSLNNA